MATGRKPAVLRNSGTTSLSHAAPSGSGRRRPRGVFFWGQPGIVLEAVGARGCNPRLDGSNRRRLGLTETHIQPHLAIGDVAAGQGAVPQQREKPVDTQSAVIAGCATCFASGPPLDSRLRSGDARRASQTLRHLLILIVVLVPP